MRNLLTTTIIGGPLWSAILKLLALAASFPLTWGQAYAVGWLIAFVIVMTGRRLEVYGR